MNAAQDLSKTLEDRYGPAFATGIQDSLNRQAKHQSDFTKMQKMAEARTRYRHQVSELIEKYRSWQRQIGNLDETTRVYAGYDGAMLRKQIQDTFKLYRMVHRDYLDVLFNYRDK